MRPRKIDGFLTPPAPRAFSRAARLIEEYGNGGDVFQLTQEGYKVGDAL
jgi:hypothetical protein